MPKPKLLSILISFFISLVLSVAPLPAALLPLNPAWCLITLLFWTYGAPHSVNVGIAWCLGIVMDGLTGSLLGLHAFAYVIITFAFDLFYRRFHMFHLLQQSVVVGILVAGQCVIIFSFEHMLTNNVIIWPVMLSAITSAVCWPFYQFFGQKLHLTKG